MQSYQVLDTKLVMNCNRYKFEIIALIYRKQIYINHKAYYSKTTIVTLEVEKIYNNA